MEGAGEPVTTDINSTEEKCEENNAEEPSSPTDDKIEILMKATGNAPILKKKKWKVEKEKSIGEIMVFIKRYMKLNPTESLFFYVNQSFAPSPDQIIKNLYECYGANGTLVISYCKTQAWG